MPTAASAGHQQNINRPRIVCLKYCGFSAFVGSVPSPRTVQLAAHTHSGVHSTSAKELRLPLLGTKSYQQWQWNFMCSACCWKTSCKRNNEDLSVHKYYGHPSVSDFACCPLPNYFFLPLTSFNFIIPQLSSNQQCIRLHMIWCCIMFCPGI